MTDIGGTLREARMRRRLDIIEVERATKIRAKYLRAMEDEEWSLLPGPTFVKSFLRTYGDFLGLDSRLLVEEWKRQNERVSENDLPPLAPRGGRRGGGRGSRPPREPAPWRGPALVALVLLLVLGGLYAVGKSTSDSEDTVPTPTSTSTSTTAKKKARARAKKRATRVRLSLSATAPVYVCLVDGAGKRLVNGVTLQPGPTRTYTARRLRVNLGNASVRMRVNGKPLPVPASAAGIGLELTPRGRRALPVGQRPTCTA